ncbi:MAG: DivIVA domain-containing protein [Acidimicrobiales bacterium]
MELTSEVVRQVEFGLELRGYNKEEVDDFLEKVASGLDELRAEVASTRDRVGRADSGSGDRSIQEDEESIRRTLVLAQRTADLAIKEAQEEAAQLLDAARADAESVVAEARHAAERVTSEADRKLREEVSRLSSERERLRSEQHILSGLLAAERERLTESLSTMLQFVEKNILPSPDLVAKMGPAPASSADTPIVAPDVDELEAAIAADAAAAAPSPSRHPSDLDEEWENQGSLNRPSLMALPSLEEPNGSVAQDNEATATWDFSNKADSPAS